jgi:signal peptidase I
VALVVALLLRGFVVEAFKIPSSSMAPSLLVGDHILVSKLAYGVRLPFANRLIVRWVDPRRGDVIVFSAPREPGRDLVKRVVGLPGDVLELRNQVLYVNGVPQPREPLGELAYDEQNERTGRWWTDSCLAWRERFARGRVEAGTTVQADLAEPLGSAPSEGFEVHDVLQCRRSRLGEREGPFERVAPGHVFVLGDNRDRSGDSRSGWQVPLANVKGRATLVWWSWGRSGWAPWSGPSGLRAERLFKWIE